jgi:hypothetical protein
MRHRNAVPAIVQEMRPLQNFEGLEMNNAPKMLILSEERLFAEPSKMVCLISQNKGLVHTPSGQNLSQRKNQHNKIVQAMDDREKFSFLFDTVHI